MFQKTNKMTDLVTTLREQHTTAQRLTDYILLATEKGEVADMETLMRNMRAYVRMLQAHTAYEETLLYPQIQAVASPAEFERLQTTLWQSDRDVFGPGGYAGLVAKVADLERSAGITGLAQFTPKLTAQETVASTATR